MIGEFFVTSCFFIATLSTVPFLIFSYLILQVCNKVRLSVLSFLHPDVDFVKYVTVRSLLDTHRNQGIITVLLTVKGQAQPDAVNRHLQEVVRRRDKGGNLAFPRLRQCLVARYGTYGWRRGKFDLNQNVTVALPTFKARAITEYNIQECVSDIVSKYLPTDASPWQVVIIPSSEENHYILLKIHHMLLSEGMKIGDILPLIPPTRQTSGYYYRYLPPKSPLVQVLKPPTAIPQLKQHIADEISNNWNEFVAQYDPLERPELLKTTPTLTQFFAFIALALVATVKVCRKGFRVINRDFYSRLKYVTQTGMREFQKRQISFGNLIFAIAASLQPLNVTKTALNFLVYFMQLPLVLLGLFLAETRALYSCITSKYCSHPKTIVGTLYTYVPLLYNSFNEILYMLRVAFTAPKTIVQDILLQKESLQTITLCGRKSVAWSAPVKLETVKNLSKKLGFSEIEIMLVAISKCLSKYFTQIDHNIPEALPVSMRHISSNYIFATGPNIKPEDAVSGILCMNLFVPDPDKDTSNVENLIEIKNSFKHSLAKQELSHLLTMLQTKYGVLTNFLPSTLLGVYLKYLSRKYCVSITEVTSRHPMVTQRTLWGQEVSSAIYWRPPQANTSISLCLNEYADHIKLGVMCDTQLVPHHTHLVRGFPDFLRELSNELIL